MIFYILVVYLFLSKVECKELFILEYVSWKWYVYAPYELCFASPAA